MACEALGETSCVRHVNVKSPKIPCKRGLLASPPQRSSLTACTTNTLYKSCTNFSLPHQRPTGLDLSDMMSAGPGSLPAAPIERQESEGELIEVRECVRPPAGARRGAF